MVWKGFKEELLSQCIYVIWCATPASAEIRLVLEPSESSTSPCAVCGAQPQIQVPDKTFCSHLRSPRWSETSPGAGGCDMGRVRQLCPSGPLGRTTHQAGYLFLGN